MSNLTFRLVLYTWGEKLKALSEGDISRLQASAPLAPPHLSDCLPAAGDHYTPQP